MRRAGVFGHVPMFMLYVGLLLLLVSMQGCSGLYSLVDALNERQVQSCIRWQGFAGGGWPGVPQVQVYGVTATGGVTLAQCVGQGGS